MSLIIVANKRHLIYIYLDLNRFISLDMLAEDIIVDVTTHFGESYSHNHYIMT